MASIGGNLMQRPRCLYFRDVSAACNRRDARRRLCRHRRAATAHHAILGTSDACVATHPSDLAVALVALDATVITRDADGEKPIRIADFFRQPGGTPDREHNLRNRRVDHLGRRAGAAESRRSGYLKVRDRESYEFAIASAAVALDIAGGTVRTARVAAGGVGTVPWRLPAVEQALTGRPATPDLWRDRGGPCRRRRKAIVGERVQGGTAQAHRGAAAGDRGRYAMTRPLPAALVTGHP